MRSLKLTQRIGLALLLLTAWAMVAQATGLATPNDVYTPAGGMYSCHQLQHASGIALMAEGVFGLCLTIGAFMWLL